LKSVTSTPGKEFRTSSTAPKRSGFGAGRILRASELHADEPALVVRAASDEEHAVEPVGGEDEVAKSAVDLDLEAPAPQDRLAGEPAFGREDAENGIAMAEAIPLRTTRSRPSSSVRIREK
jgi:hypothetical protein